MWCDVPWGLHSPGPTPSSYPRRVSAVVLPAGSSEKVLRAPARAHALPDVHTDRARSGAAQAAQGPRTGSAGRRGFRYRYETPEAGSKYPTQTPISACATHGVPDLCTRWPHHPPSNHPPPPRHAEAPLKYYGLSTQSHSSHTFNAYLLNYCDNTSSAVRPQEKNRMDRRPQHLHTSRVSRHGVTDAL